MAKQLNWLDTNQLDLVLVEGFRHERFAKIELHRPSLNKSLLCANDNSIIALASDADMQSDIDICTLDLNNIEQIVEFILAHVTHKTA